MIARTIGFFTLAATLCGCQITPTAQVELDQAAKDFRPEEGMCNIYIVWPAGVVRAAVPFQVTFNGVVQDISRGKYLWIVAPPREHNIVFAEYYQDYKNQAAEFKTVAGQCVYLRVGATLTKMFVENMSEDKGRKLIRASRLIERIVFVERALDQAIAKRDTHAVTLSVSQYVQYVDICQYRNPYGLLTTLSDGNDLSIIESLLAQGVDPNGVGPDGDTPLHYAASKGKIAFAQALIHRGAKVSAANDFGVTPLHWAVKSPEVMKILIDAGADVRAATHDGVTPLHNAARGQQEDACALLIRAGAEVNATDQAGNSPLHDAAYRQNAGICALLIREGANVNTRQGVRLTPLHMLVSQMTEPNICPTAQVLFENGAQASDVPGEPSITGITWVVYGLLVKNSGNTSLAKEYFARAVPLLDASIAEAHKRAKSASSKAFWTSVFEPVPQNPHSGYRHGAIQQTMMSGIGAVVGEGRKSQEWQCEGIEAEVLETMLERYLAECQRQLKP